MWTALRENAECRAAEILPAVQALRKARGWRQEHYRRAREKSPPPQKPEQGPREKTDGASTALEESWHESRFGGHGGAIGRVSKKNFFLRRKTLRKNDGVGKRACDSGNPRGVNQWKKKHFKKNRGVIRVAHVTKWARRDNAEFRRVHHLHVPVFTERSNDPPTNRVGSEREHERSCGQRRNKRPVQKNNFDRSADQNSRVQQNHPAKLWIGDF